MSLNGLDVQAVQEACDLAVNETTGWFLLKYNSRDTVELLASGKNGVAEAKSAIAQFEEKSPLYGLIMFRRRKVLIKYIPDGTSRLLQARTAVHFQDVVEKFSPYEALIEITSAEGFNDTSLSAAFPLHTAGHSPALSNLSKLSEISESAEEGSPSQPTLPAQNASLSSLATRRSRAAWKRSATVGPLTSLGLEGGQRSPSLHTKPAMSQFLYTEEAGQSIVTPLETPPIHVYAPDEGSVSLFNPSKLSNDELGKTMPLPAPHPTRDLPAEYDAFDFKPKVKLGPRPVTVADRRRAPQTSGMDARPTSALPAGVQVRNKHSDTSSTMSSVTCPVLSSNDPSPTMKTLPTPPPIPNTPEYFPAPPSLRGSSKSLPGTRSKAMMTPEKQRLLKAVEMRKKQLQKAQTAVADSAPAIEPHTPELRPMTPVKESRTERHSEDSKTADSGIDVGDETPSAQRHSQAKAPSPPSRSPDRKVAVLATPEKVVNQTLYDTMETDDDITPRVVPEMTLPIQLNMPHQTNAEENLPSVESTRPVSVTLPDVQTTEELSPVQKKRRGLLVPLQLSIINDPSSDNDSDDDLIEELQSATLHEAKPLTVSQASPATPVYASRRPSAMSYGSNHSKSPSGNGSPRFGPSQRSASIPLDVMHAPGGLGIFESPVKQGRSHSISAATPTKDGEDSIAVARRGQVSSGIVKRIAALAEVTTKDSSPPSSQSSGLSPGASLATRKTSLGRNQDPQRAPSMSWNQRSKTTLSGPNDRSQNTYTVERNLHSNRDSVSVTARIVRRSSTTGEADPSVSGHPGDLHESPILINHKRGTHSQSSIKSSHLAPVNMPREEDPAILILSPQNETLSPVLSQASVEDRRFSRRSFGRNRNTNSHTVSPTIPQEAVSVWEDDPPKVSRTSRFFKRMSTMSNGLTGKRASKAPSTAPIMHTSVLAPASPEIPRQNSVSAKDVPPAVIVGDVNVQFPGQGLWKRRWVEIDDGGYIVLMVSKTPDFRMGTTKRFHLTEFSKVYIPEVDSQDLGNSVVLDFASGNGGSMQCATEDSMAQRQLVSLLRTYHQAWLAA